ncbi:uncharacterized protein PG986_010693 [Apiospora aurea]|uniref:Uncharacterized protein n=1 Tax=Apiospora aurea TaxID=335848 RepID=A0ABR1Q356_9PEZI
MNPKVGVQQHQSEQTRPVVRTQVHAMPPACQKAQNDENCGEDGDGGDEEARRGHKSSDRSCVCDKATRADAKPSRAAVSLSMTV